MRLIRRDARLDQGQQPLAADYPRGVAEPRRILIDWDYGASGLWWCSCKEEHEAP